MCSMKQVLKISKPIFIFVLVQCLGYLENIHNTVKPVNFGYPKVFYYRLSRNANEDFTQYGSNPNLFVFDLLLFTIVYLLVLKSKRFFYRKSK